MTEALSSAVEKVLAHEDVSEEHAKLKAEVQAQWDEYKASGDTMLFDSPEWHALQSIDAGDYEGDVELVRTFTSNTLDMHRRFHRQSIIPWAVWRLTATPKCLMPTAMSSPAFMRLVK